MIKIERLSFLLPIFFYFKNGVNIVNDGLHTVVHFYRGSTTTSTTVKVTVLYCTVLYCTVLYCTVLYCTALYCNVLYCTVLHRGPLLPGLNHYINNCKGICTLLYCTVLYCMMVCELWSTSTGAQPLHQQL